eukprot:COSAG02_NODE_4492_length_5296_cov_57.568597_2_plen_72_part_00
MIGLTRTVDRNVEKTPAHPGVNKSSCSGDTKRSSNLKSNARCLDTNTVHHIAFSTQHFLGNVRAHYTMQGA